MIKGIIFDFYETLIEPDIKSPSAYEYLNLQGYASSKMLEDQWMSDAFDGQLTPTTLSDSNYQDWLLSNYKEFAKLSKVPLQDLDRVIKELIENDRNWTFKAKPYANEIIDFCLSKGLRIGICSNWDYPLEQYLIQTGLSVIKNVSVSCEIGARKPHPLIFEDILIKTNLKPHEALFIGDTWAADIVGSTNIGLEAIYLKSDPQDKISNTLALHFKTLKDVKGYIENKL